MRWLRRGWMIVTDRGDEVPGCRFWTQRMAEREATHMSIYSSCNFTEAKARLIGEPISFQAVRVAR